MKTLTLTPSKFTRQRTRQTVGRLNHYRIVAILHRRKPIALKREFGTWQAASQFARQIGLKGQINPVHWERIDL